jgi:hypothetical protein
MNMSDTEKNVQRNARDVARIIPYGAPVAVTLADDERVKPEFRGKTLHGFWLGIVPNPKIPQALRSNLEGSHWLAEFVDVRNDQLLWEPTLSSIVEIDIAPNQVAKERDS